MTPAPWRSPATTCGSRTSRTGRSRGSTCWRTKLSTRSRSAATPTRSRRDPPGPGGPTAGAKPTPASTPPPAPPAPPTASAPPAPPHPPAGPPPPPIDVGLGPDGLAVDDASVWVANGGDGTVLHIDGRTGDPMSPAIPVGSGPSGMARVGDDLWVANELSQSV